MVIPVTIHVDALPIRSPLKTSPHNQQMLLGKWKDSGFDGQANRANQMATTGLENLLSKHLSQNKNQRRRAIRMIRKMDSKTFIAHSTLHLLTFNDEMIWELMITGENGQNKRARLVSLTLS